MDTQAQKQEIDAAKTQQEQTRTREGMLAQLHPDQQAQFNQLPPEVQAEVLKQAGVA